MKEVQYWAGTVSVEQKVSCIASDLFSTRGERGSLGLAAVLVVRSNRYKATSPSPCAGREVSVG